MRFQNPANGYIDDKGAPWLWSLLFGGFYLIASGLWAPFLIWLILAALLFASMGPPATVLMMIVNVIYAAMAHGLIRSAYLRKGWVEVGDDANSTETGEWREQPGATVSAPLKRKCPFCAEEILAEAIKCKHCGSTVEPIKQEDPPVAVEENKPVTECPKCQSRVSESQVLCGNCGAVLRT